MQYEQEVFFFRGYKDLYRNQIISETTRTLTGPFMALRQEEYPHSLG